MSARGHFSVSVLPADARVAIAWFHPAPRLLPLVECYWTLDVADASPPHPAEVRALPDARVDLVFDLSPDATTGAPRAWLAGPRQSADCYRHTRPTHLLGATLLPTALGPLFGLSPARLSADWHALESLLGDLGRELTAAVAALAGRDSRLAFLDAFLAARLADAHVDVRVRRAIVAVEGAGGDIDVGSLSARVAASPRQLTRLFRDCMGMGPKRFGRIVRAQAALRRLVQGETPLADLAADLGYADQAHLTRELRQLFGVAPARLARQIRPSESR